MNLWDYLGLGGRVTSAEREKLANIAVGVKSNLNATTPPTKADDCTKDYSVGSTWKTNDDTYTCTDNTKDNAVWVNVSSMYYFLTWEELQTELDALTTNYVNKYATVANANGGPSPETEEYTAPGAVWKPIYDGGGAIYKIIAQAENTFTVLCQPRTTTNPIVNKVFLNSEALPSAPGFYIFAKTPIGGLPSGIELNDIANFDGTKWAVFQKYAHATAVLVASSVSSLAQVTWRKFAGTWMSTADEYIPDSQEYQTGKLYNGKPVYRKCQSGIFANVLNSSVSTGLSIPMTGIILSIAGVCLRTDNSTITITGNGEAQILVSSSGVVSTWTSSNLYLTRQYKLWVEYTKS